MRTGYLYINLDRERPRRIAMERSAAQMSLSFRRLSAVDLRTLEQDPPEGFRPRWFRHERWTLRPFEIAVFESHRKAWSAFLADDLDLAVIMEDDLLFAGGFGQAVAALAGHSARFDIVRLNHSIQSRRLGPALDGLPGIELRPIHENIADAGCYLLSRRAAERLLEQSRRYCSHLDDFLFSPDRGLRILQLLPPISGQVIHLPGAAPAIEGFNVSARVDQPRLTERGPVAFRVFKECRRLAKRGRWGLGSILSGGRRVDLAERLRHFRPIVPD